MVAVVSAVQSKAGLYGFLAIATVMLPGYVHEYAMPLIVLGAVSLVYGAVIALVQNDAKRIVAYSSLSHLGLIIIAVASQQPLALDGALVYMVAHGLFSAALFLLLGYVEDREATRRLAEAGRIGLGESSPLGRVMRRGAGRARPTRFGRICRRAAHPHRPVPGWLRLARDRRAGRYRARLGLSAASLSRRDERAATRGFARSPRSDVGSKASRSRRCWRRSCSSASTRRRF